MKVLPTKILNDRDLVTATIRLRDFRPAAGTETKILTTPEVGGSRLTYLIFAEGNPRLGLAFEVEGPPSDEVLRYLYLQSERVAKAAEVSEADARPTGINVGGRVIDLPGIGYDQ